MTTPDDTTDDATRRTDRTTDSRRTEAQTTDPRPTDTQTTNPTDRTAPSTPSRTVPGRVPRTEGAGAPIVPPTGTRRPSTERTDRRTARPRSAGSSPRTDARPPADGERDAPLVPDLRPATDARTDGGSR